MENKELNFEEAMSKLELVIKELESGNCSLDDAMDKYATGMKLVKFCDDKLKSATEKVNKILKDGELKDFEIPSEE